MNGATALDCENTIRRPNSTNTTMIGTSQYFFSWRRNAQNSVNTRPLLMVTSVHAFVMLRIAIARRIRRPSWEPVTTAHQRILAAQPPDHRQRNEHDRKENREEDSGVHVAERAREPPPRGARVLQQRRVHESGREEKGADAADH